MMDKRVIKIVLVMVCSTFGVLAVAVGVKMYVRAQGTYVEREVDRADAFIQQGRTREAAKSLTKLRQRRLDSDERQQVDQRLANLQDELSRMDQERHRSEQVKRHRAEQERTGRKLLAEHNRLRKQANLELVGGAYTGSLVALMALGMGAVAIGFGQLFMAIRDIAINSYLVTRAETVPTARTQAPPGHVVPPYGIVRFLAVSYYVGGVAQVLIGVGMLIFIAVNL